MKSYRASLLSIHLLATVTLAVLAIGTAAVYLPMLYEKLFLHQADKTHLLFSPVTKRFIYREKIVGIIPPESYEKATDHRPQYAYRDQNGRWYTRVEFEKRLPFIYYKNMELWGLLPLKIDGNSFDKAVIKQERQVWEFNKGEDTGNCLTESLYPLLESNPGQVRLSFPQDRFRMTRDRMEFVNVHTNRVDEKLSTLFTRALNEKGFAFPVRSVNGKFSILKPFDAGVFMVDNNYNVFHVKRISGVPEVVKTSIDPALKTKQIKVSEKKSRAYYGLLLSEAGVLHLISSDNYRVFPLPLKGYDPRNMDVKLVMDPLHVTAIYSDDRTVYGVAMTRDFTPVAKYQRQMSRATRTMADKMHAVLFPFCIKLEQVGGAGRLQLSCTTGGGLSLVGIGASLLFLCVLTYLKDRKIPAKQRLLFVTLTGIYGVIVLLFVEGDN